MDVLPTILNFFADIGIVATARELTEATFLPGVVLDGNGLAYDVARLTYPGDLLHEAGHLAFTPAAERPALSIQTTFTLGDDFAAIAWSWAALTHLGLDPTVVFHDGGYSGWSPAYIDNFAHGHYVGVSLLEWADLTLEPRRNGPPGETYPAMKRWLRE